MREQNRLLDRGLVILAVERAKHHPSPSTALPTLKPSYSPYDYQGVFDELAATGCVSFDDDAVTEFAIAAGLTERSARRLIRESIMLVHFLPRVWSRVMAGGLDVWRARNIAGNCFGLTPKAVDFIDSQMGQSVARITPTTRESVVEEARKRFMPEAEESAENEAKNARTVEINIQASQHSIVPVQACLDLPDALALEAAIAAGAEALADAGSQAPLSTRRSWALGDLARAASGESTLLTSDSSTCTCTCNIADHAVDSSRPRWNGKGSAPPAVKIFIHLASDTLTSPPGTAGIVGKVEGTGIPGTRSCTPETIREWFTRTTLAGAFMPRISVRPVLDRNEVISSGAYRPSERSHELVQLAHESCVFPFCTRPSHICDADHTIPWKEDGSGGATCTCNLAPLCRTHHRLKTHGDNAPSTDGEHNTWAYTHLGGEEYYWNGPREWRFIRNELGTFDASSGLRGGAPPHPSLTTTPEQRLAATLGDDLRRDAGERLIGRLLTKASLTRGMHATALSPRWVIPPHEATIDPTLEPLADPPDEWDDSGDYVGPNTFFLIEANFPVAA